MTHREKQEDYYERKSRKDSMKLIRFLCAFLFIVVVGRMIYSLFK